MKYIDADKLKYEIERRKLSNYYTDTDDYEAELFEIIDSLQQEQPEVDLEKEIDRFWDSCIKHKNERGGNVIWSNKLEVEVLARHFFDMGINARKL